MDLSENFHQHLEAEIAVTRHQLLEAQRLRYEVYCQERGYEDSSRFSDRCETDEYDKNAVHAVIRHRKSAAAVGVVRLVLPDPADPDQPLPIEKHSGHVFDRALLRRYRFSRSNIAEVSRFAVSSNLLVASESRQTACGSGTTPDMSDLLDDYQRNSPHITSGLIAMLFVISRLQGITHWYAVMEPSLSRLLTRFGIKFQPIGPLVDFHGKRQPMIASVNDLLASIRKERSDFHELVRRLGGVPDSQRTQELLYRDYNKQNMG